MVKWYDILGFPFVPLWRMLTRNNTGLDKGLLPGSFGHFSGFGSSEHSAFSDLFGTSFSGLLKAITNRITAEHMTGADKEAAEMSYNQQVQFFNDFQSPQAQVQQYQEAGLNPALMYGRGASPASPISGSATASSPSLNPLSMISSVVDMAMRAKELGANIALKSSEANLNNANADLVRKNFDAFEERLGRERGAYDLSQRIGNKSIEEVDSRILVNAAEVELKRSQIDLNSAQKEFTEWQSAIAKIDADSREQLNDALLAIRRAQANLQNAQTGRIKQEIDYWEKIKDERVSAFKAELHKLENQNKISDNEVKYWDDEKRLETISIITQAYANTKDEFKSFVAGWTKHSNHNMKEMGLFPNSFDIASYFRP